MTFVPRMHDPLISIIMAARNTAPYLPRCLDSICAQTYRNWELIVVNDHSTDGTRSILNTYARRDKRIRVFDSEGRRLIPALQTGQRQVRGDLINRMDSDDYMPPDKLEALYQVWRKHGKGRVAAGGTEHFVDEGEVGGGFRRYEQWLNGLARTNTHFKHIYKECVIPSHCWLIHRDDFFAVGGFEPEVYPEDYDLCFRFYQAGYEIIGVDKVVHYWRDRSDRISRTWDEYKDNRYYDLKLRYFFTLDRDEQKPLVLWGAGRNGKDLAKGLQQMGGTFRWICSSPRKVGHIIYGVKLEDPAILAELKAPQILVAVASPSGQQEIVEQLDRHSFALAQDYWLWI